MPLYSGGLCEAEMTTPPAALSSRIEQGDRRRGDDARTSHELLSVNELYHCRLKERSRADAEWANRGAGGRLFFSSLAVCAHLARIGQPFHEAVIYP